ncbi:phosphatidate cytidylyltransferase [Geodermatophilus sp. URMC 63]
MTPRPEAPGAGPSGPGRPRPQVTRLLGPARPVPGDADTGPVPVVGRPSPPPPPAAPQPPPTSPIAVPLPEGAPAADPPRTQELPVPAAVVADPAERQPAEHRAAGASRPAARRGSGRAGRDLVAAIGVGLGLGAVILASLLVYRPAFLLVVTVAILVGVVELVRALEAGRARAPLAPLVAGTVAMSGLAWTRGPDGLVVAFLFTVVAVLLWRLGDGPEGYLRDASAGVLVALYVPLLAGFAVLLLVPDDGAVRVLVFIATVVGNDVGGYTAGVLFGRHPMAPSVSPKKSWEGMAGSVVTCVAVATPIVTLALDGPWWGGVLFGAALAVTATAGDLGESLIKRDLGIKDMGTLLPGHGGIMDRLDSLLPSAVAAYLLLSWVAPPL